jgi:DNA-binding XRE family transcriptional regulator
MTPDQMRMARAKLDLSQDQVAEEIGITKKTLSNAENGTNKLSSDNLDKLKFFFTTRGLEFTDFNGVRETPTGLRTFKGKSGFQEFYEDQYKTFKAEGGDIWLYNGVSKLIIDALGMDYVEMHKARMSKIKNKINYRVIVEEGDATFFGSDYAHYRWLPKEQFNDKTIFVYGSKVGLVNFDDDITVVLIEQKEFADTLRRLMENMWDMNAKEPSV